jgi:hypothetical protein
MVSCVTEGERLGRTRNELGELVPKIGDLDEIDAAKKYLADCRKYKWEGMDENSPKQEWE